MGGGVKKVIAKSVENRERIRPLAEQGLDSKEIATRIRLGIGETESFIEMIRTVLAIVPKFPKCASP